MNESLEQGNLANIFVIFVNTAKAELDDISKLCNIFSLVTHNVASCSQSSESILHSTSKLDARSYRNPISMCKKKQSINNLYKYHKCLESIREIHHELILISFSLKNDGIEKEIESMCTDERQMMYEKMEKHIQLSQRVIRTCMIGKFDRFGLILENNDDYDCRIVALAALNSSVQRLERWRLEISATKGVEAAY